MWFLIVLLSISAIAIIGLAVWKIRERINRVSIVRGFFNKSKYRIECKIGKEETVYVYSKDISGYITTFIYVNEERISRDKIKGDIDELMDAQIADLTSGEIEVYKNGIIVPNEKRRRKRK